MTERQSAYDHPRSDDVKGRDRHDGEDEKGVGDTGHFGDQGISQSTDPEFQRNQAAASAGETPSPDGGSQVH